MQTRPARLAPALVALAAAVLAACGSNSPNNSIPLGGSGSTPGTTQFRDESVTFSRCMRADGVPNFPDPPGNGGFGLKDLAQRGSNGQTMSINGVSVNAPAFRAAMAKCQKYIPEPPVVSASELANVRAQAVQFGRCMRSHGITNFPDPRIQTGVGGHGIAIDNGPGINPNSPAFEAARQTCQSKTGFGPPRPAGH